MAPPSELKIIEVFQVSPPTAAAAPFSLPLTQWDVQWLRFAPTQRLFFYEASEACDSFTPSVLPPLKHSLSLALRHFQPLAGALVWPPDSDEPYVRVNGDSAGISLTVAESGADFRHLCGDGPRDSAEFRPLVPCLAAGRDRAAVMALQVTNFPGRGFSIGVTAHHAVIDGRAVQMFVKSWAHLCRAVRNGDGTEGLPSELTPFYDRSGVRDPGGDKQASLKWWLNETGPDGRSLEVFEMTPPEGTVRATFRLPSTDIEVLRRHVDARAAAPIRASSFVLACAYAWVCLAKAEGMEREKTAYFCFPADLRARVKPPLPPTYFGNCISGLMGAVPAANLVSCSGIVAAAEALSGQIWALKEDAPSSVAETWAAVWRVFLSGRVVSVAGSPQFKVYETDFGWGRVRKAEIVSTEKTGALALSENGGGGGGIEIGVVLGEGVMKTYAATFSDDLAAIKDESTKCY